ncbi:P44/Msp2 family outer membrane protein [Anaplasma bovis]|uniref:P44/Msp2 family outer membrane protein n=1 Tax=Anaplasma bovis TaxID=186733 RepID=UPI002FF144E0
MKSMKLSTSSTRIYKPVLVLVMLCAAGASSIEEVVRGVSMTDEGLYFSSSYRSSFPNFGNLEVEEANNFVPGVGTVMKMSMQGSVTVDTDNEKSFTTYRSSFYDNDYFGFSGSIGYRIGDIRMEFESFHNEFNVRGAAGSMHEDDPAYIALVRGKAISKTNYVLVKNEKIGVSSITFNVCCDIRSKHDPIVSYVCMGISGNVIDILDTSEVTHGYYGKMGVGIAVTDDALLFIGGYYHAMHRDTFDNIKLIVPSANGMDPRPTFASAKISTAYLGGEIGVRYMF